MTNKQKLSLGFLVMSLLGLYASFGLMLDKLSLLQNTQFAVACSNNPLLSCIQVMQTPYADMFGFPNQIFGLIGYSAMATMAMSALLEKGVIGKKTMLLALITAGGAFVYSYYLLGISMFLIGALCTLCLLSCFAATMIFWIVLYLALTSDSLGKQINGLRLVRFLQKPRNFVIVVVIWFLLVFAALCIRFPGILSW